MRRNEDPNLLKPWIFESATQQLISHGAGHASEIQIVKNQYVSNAKFACCVLSHVPSRWPWYYPQDKVLVLWESYLYDFTRDVPLLKDTNMAHLWTGFEQWLLTRYPETESIVTPYADPIWNVKEYQAFLRARGYTKGHPGTFAKLLK